MTTVDGEIRARIAATLALLDAMPETVRTRELRAKANTYRWGVEQWASTNVSVAQRFALHELVEELHATVTHEGIPESSIVPRGPLSTPTAWAAPRVPKRRT